MQDLFLNQRLSITYKLDECVIFIDHLSFLTFNIIKNPMAKSISNEAIPNLCEENI